MAKSRLSNKIVYVPIEEVLANADPTTMDRFVVSYMRLLADKDNSYTKSRHIARIGRQSYVFTSEFRHYVWETESWRVFVAKGKGISFEVVDKMTSEQAWAAWADYVSRVWNEEVL